MSHTLISESNNDMLSPKNIGNILKLNFNQNFTKNNSCLDSILFLRNKYQQLKILNSQIQFAYLALNTRFIDMS